MPRKSPKQNCKRPFRRRAAARQRGSGARRGWVVWGARGARATGRKPSCRTCPRPPSARPSRADSPRYRPWRRGGAAAGAAAGGAWSWSGARWTWSASCGPTAPPTTRSTSATASETRSYRPHY